MSETVIPRPELPDDEDVPDWEDEYVDRVSDRLMFNYDLAKDVQLRDESFGMYGRMKIHNEKHFFHPVLSFAHHDLFEHLFVRRTSAATIAEFERLAEFGHDLAEHWIDADERHYSTDFTFVLVGSEIPDDARSFVSSFSDRTMLKYGYNGHYEISLVAVAPDREELVASDAATVEEAFRLWEPIEKEEPGLWKLFTRRMQL